MLEPKQLDRTNHLRPPGCRAGLDGTVVADFIDANLAVSHCFVALVLPRNMKTPLPLLQSWRARVPTAKILAGGHNNRASAFDFCLAIASMKYKFRRYR